MKQGIVTAFLTSQKTRSGKNLAVLETDEANVELVTKYVKPKVFVLTNIFRDQMDRYGEIYTTYAKILAGIKLEPSATIIANGDAPIFNSITFPNPVIYYGIDAQEDKEQQALPNTDGLLCPRCQHILHYKQISYANLGKYYCSNCDFKRPELEFSVSKITQQTPQSSEFVVNDTAINLHIGGAYNIYNALAAYSIARFFEIDSPLIAAALNDNDEKIFGRQEVINVDDKKNNLDISEESCRLRSGT